MEKQKETREIGGQEFEVISSYSDSQAVEDGILVAITGRDRVTVACWAWIRDNLPSEGSPPDRWPVDLMGWCTGDKTLAATRGLIGSFDDMARRAWDAKDLLTLYVQTMVNSGTITGVFTDEPDDDAHTRLWLIPNENGGVTLMFPEDY